jgi:hypothetical protein
VRQGESYALVDVGPDPALLRRCLDRLSIHSIDLLVLTHYDPDHVGGLSAVLGQVSIALIGPAENDRDQKMARTLTDSGADVRQAHQGDSGFLGDLPWQILWPRDGTDAWQSCNITIEFEVPSGQFSGDLGEDAQRQVMANHLSDVDVVRSHITVRPIKARFLSDNLAEIGIVSVGADNGTGIRPTSVSTFCRTQTTVFEPSQWRLCWRHPRQELWCGQRAKLGWNRKAEETMAATRGSSQVASATTIPRLSWEQIRPAPVILVSGTESFLAERSIRQLRDLLKEEDPSLEITDIDAASYAPGQLLTMASPSLFGEPRLIRVSAVEKCTDDFLVETIEYLKHPADGTYVVLRHAGGVRGKRLLDTIRSGSDGIEVICAELKKDTERFDFASAEFTAGPTGKPGRHSRSRFRLLR